MKKTLFSISFILSVIVSFSGALSHSDAKLLGPVYKVSAKVLKIEGTKQISANRPAAAGGESYQTHAYKMRIGLLDVKQGDESGKLSPPRDFDYRRGIEIDTVAILAYEVRAAVIAEEVFIQGYLQKVGDASGESHRLQITDSSGRL